MVRVGVAMEHGPSPAARALRRAHAAHRYACRTGCDIGEATSALAEREAGAPPADAAGAGADAGGRVSRRQVLRGAAAAGLAAAVPAGALCWPPAARAAARPGPRVVVIGSGIAGLGCAFRLWARPGVASEVYEYNPARAGGRIGTLRGFFTGGQYAEEHGEFISSEHTAMRHLAARFGLTRHQREDRDAVLAPGVERRSLDGEPVHGRHRAGRLGDDGGPARRGGHPHRAARRRDGAGLGRRYGLTSYEGPAPPAMARDFLACFEQNFPGAGSAYNGRAHYAWSAGDPHTGGAYSYLKTGQYTAFNGIQGRRSGNLHLAGSTPR